MSCSIQDIGGCIPYNVPAFNRCRIIDQKQIVGVYYNLDGTVTLSIDPAYEWSTLPVDNIEFETVNENELYNFTITVPVPKSDPLTVKYSEILTGGKWFVELTGRDGQRNGVQNCTAVVGYTRNSEDNLITYTFNASSDKLFFLYTDYTDPYAHTYSLPPLIPSNFQCVTSDIQIANYIVRDDGFGYYYYLAPTSSLPNIQWMGYYYDCEQIGNISTCVPQQDVGLNCYTPPSTAITLSEYSGVITNNPGCVERLFFSVTSNFTWTASKTDSNIILTVSDAGVLIENQTGLYTSEQQIITINNGYQDVQFVVNKKQLRWQDTTVSYKVKVAANAITLNLPNKLNIGDTVSSPRITSDWLSVNGNSITINENTSTSTDRTGVIYWSLSSNPCCTIQYVVEQQRRESPKNPTISIIGSTTQCTETDQQLSLIFQDMQSITGRWNSSSSTTTVSQAGVVSSGAVEEVVRITFTADNSLHTQGVFDINVIDCGLPPEPEYDVSITGCDVMSAGESCQLGISTTCFQTTGFVFGLSSANHCLGQTVSSTGLVTIPEDSCYGIITVYADAPSACNFNRTYKTITIQQQEPETDCDNQTCGDIYGQTEVYRGESYNYTRMVFNSCQEGNYGWHWTLTTDGVNNAVSTWAGIGDNKTNAVNIKLSVSRNESSNYLYLKYVYNSNSNMFCCRRINVYTYTPEPTPICNIGGNYWYPVCAENGSNIPLTYVIGNVPLTNLTSTVPVVYTMPELTVYGTWNRQSLPQKNYVVSYNLCGNSGQYNFSTGSSYITWNNNLYFYGQYNVMMETNTWNMTQTYALMDPQNLVSTTNSTWTKAGNTWTFNRGINNNGWINFSGCGQNLRFFWQSNVPDSNILFTNYCNGQVLKQGLVKFYPQNNALDRGNSGTNYIYNIPAGMTAEPILNTLKGSGAVYRNSFTTSQGSNYYVYLYPNGIKSLNVRVSTACSQRDFYAVYNFSYNGMYQCSTESFNFNTINLRSRQWRYPNLDSVPASVLNNILPAYINTAQTTYTINATSIQYVDDMEDSVSCPQATFYISKTNNLSGRGSGTQVYTSQVSRQLVGIAANACTNQSVSYTNVQFINNILPAVYNSSTALEAVGLRKNTIFYSIPTALNSNYGWSLTEPKCTSNNTDNTVWFQNVSTINYWYINNLGGTYEFVNFPINIQIINTNNCFITNSTRTINKSSCSTYVSSGTYTGKVMTLKPPVPATLINIRIAVYESGDPAYVGRTIYLNNYAINTGTYNVDGLINTTNVLYQTNSVWTWQNVFTYNGTYNHNITVTGNSNFYFNGFKANDVNIRWTTYNSLMGRWQLEPICGYNASNYNQFPDNIQNNLFLYPTFSALNYNHRYLLNNVKVNQNLISNKFNYLSNNYYMLLEFNTLFNYTSNFPTTNLLLSLFQNQPVLNNVTSYITTYISSFSYFEIMYNENICLYNIEGHNINFLAYGSSDFYRNFVISPTPMLCNNFLTKRWGLYENQTFSRICNNNWYKHYYNCNWGYPIESSTEKSMWVGNALNYTDSTFNMLYYESYTADANTQLLLNNGRIYCLLEGNNFKQYQVSQNNGIINLSNYQERFGYILYPYHNSINRFDNCSFQYLYYVTNIDNGQYEQYYVPASSNNILYNYQQNCPDWIERTATLPTWQFFYHSGNNNFGTMNMLWFQKQIIQYSDIITLNFYPYNKYPREKTVLLGPPAGTVITNNWYNDDWNNGIINKKTYRFTGHMNSTITGDVFRNDSWVHFEQMRVEPFFNIQVFENTVVNYSGGYINIGTLQDTRNYNSTMDTLYQLLNNGANFTINFQTYNVYDYISYTFYSNYIYDTDGHNNLQFYNFKMNNTQFGSYYNMYVFKYNAWERLEPNKYYEYYTNQTALQQWVGGNEIKIYFNQEGNVGSEKNIMWVSPQSLPWQQDIYSGDFQINVIFNVFNEFNNTNCNYNQAFLFWGVANILLNLNYISTPSQNTVIKFFSPRPLRVLCDREYLFRMNINYNDIPIIKNSKFIFENILWFGENPTILFQYGPLNNSFSTFKVTNILKINEPLEYKL